MSHKTAGILVVGDEILKGKTADTNAPFFAKRLFGLGIKVLRIIAVPDNIDDIASELRKLYENYDYVITCGGIGPTHDDVTYEGVAKAFDEILTLHPEMSKIVQNLTSSQYAQKMAILPKSASLIPVAYTEFPVVRVKNVFVLPGLPKWCEAGFMSLVNKIFSNSSQFYSQEVMVAADELAIINALNITVNSFENRVSLGSYPFICDDGAFKTRITFDGSDLDDVCCAKAFFLKNIPAKIVENAFTIEDAKKVLSLADGSSHLSEMVQKAIEVTRESIKKYSFDRIMLCFNGGKDCTVLLHILWAIMKLENEPSCSLTTFNVVSADAFPEIVDFLQSSVKRYDLVLIEVPGPIKTALESLTRKNPKVNAVWMGTRRADPFSQHLKYFHMCDPGWPAVERVNPLLDWSYKDIWDFLRILSIPYCKLYDDGYTSIGNRVNTSRNPALYDSNTQTYKPAYLLTEGHLERQGRK